MNIMLTHQLCVTDANMSTKRDTHIDIGNNLRKWNVTVCVAV